jgi:methylphosphotriester-DNA--protein-cysteine methyltransferase
MIKHNEISNTELRAKIRQQQISFGGNIILKIYGTLQCRSGKRMKRENRVFFSSETEAIEKGYRPCGHCMKKEYNTKLIYNLVLKKLV